ncbi:MAG: TlyA family RNA methyltransferase [Thermoleophilia bacterium]|nr:TlyA family RNA methyltransferase [Thermoleophilia bacterium]
MADGRLPGKVRLDQLLVERRLVQSRNVAQGLIMAGRVRVGGKVVDKAGCQMSPDAVLEIVPGPRFVSRAGEKLAHALRVFSVDVTGVRALDVGASTGGFVDCLLQGGAAEVIALDVGYGQLDARLRDDPRVHVLERVNARYLEAGRLPYEPDFLTTDVSFISLEKVLPAVVACMTPVFRGVLLVKPQFEAGPERVGRGGIVRDRVVRADVLRRITRFLQEGLGLNIDGVAPSGLPGVGGNVEFVVVVRRGGAEGLSLATLEATIEDIVA